MPRHTETRQFFTFSQLLNFVAPAGNPTRSKPDVIRVVVPITFRVPRSERFPPSVASQLPDMHVVDAIGTAAHPVAAMYCSQGCWLSPGVSFERLVYAL